MNIYLIERTDEIFYENYIAAVVIAENEEIARNMYPGSGRQLTQKDLDDEYRAWVSDIKNVKVTLIGLANFDKKPRVVLASSRDG
jgi:diphthamide biosynthesis methyltransferase